MMIGIVRLPNLSMGRGNGEYLTQSFCGLGNMICFTTVEEVLVLLFFRYFHGY